MVRYVFKVLLLGNGAVGKTSLLYRFIENKFSANYNITIGVDFLTKEITFNGDSEAKLTVWDVAGQKKFQFMRETIYKGTNGALLVFDLTRGQTYADIEAWLSEVWKIVDEDIPFVLIGNKVDLIEDTGRAVDQEAAKDLAEGNRSIYIETSAKTGEKVEDAFLELTRRMAEKRRLEEGIPIEKEAPAQQKPDLQEIPQEKEKPSLVEIPSTIEIPTSTDAAPVEEESTSDEITLVEVEEEIPPNPFMAQGLLIKAFYNLCGRDALPIIKSICGRQGTGIGRQVSEQCFDNRLSSVAEEFAKMLTPEARIIYSGNDRFQIQCFSCPFGLENTSRELCEAVMTIDQGYFNAILFDEIEVVVLKSLAEGHGSCDIIYELKTINDD